MYVRMSMGGQEVREDGKQIGIYIDVSMIVQESRNGEEWCVCMKTDREAKKYKHTDTHAHTHAHTHIHTHTHKHTYIHTHTERLQTY